jgi:hypothetical protein
LLWRFDQFTSSTTSGATTNYAYAGPRNDERTTAGGTSFLNGTLGITRQTIAGAATSFIRDPDGTLNSMRTSTGASFYYTTDALGSVIALTDSAQAKAATYTYDSWGNGTSTGTAAAANPWRYAGGSTRPPSLEDASPPDQASSRQRVGDLPRCPFADERPHDVVVPDLKDQTLRGRGLEQRLPVRTAGFRIVDRHVNPFFGSTIGGGHQVRDDSSPLGEGLRVVQGV